MKLTKLLSIFLFGLLNAEKAPVVNIPHLGKIKGSFRESLNRHKYYTFEGVPYASPPVGQYRFKEPVPEKPWNGTWEAQTMHKCLQYQQYVEPWEDVVTGDEDCLYLNIYTPTLDKKAKLDVVVHIYGGAFMFLYGGFFGPDFIMDRDVVFINFNYRLGPLGFLSTEDEVVPGNNGIEDQIMALRWIKTNVQYFGGNSDSITLTGMSSGGTSVHIHYLSPKSRGLFHRGISQSGTSLCAWSLMEKPLEKTQKIAFKLGCFSNITEHMINCLRQRPARQIVAAVKELQPWMYNPFVVFGPVVDSWSSNPVLPDHPLNLIKKGQVSDLPWIVSVTDFEGLYPAVDFVQKEYLKEIDARWNELMPFILDYNDTVDSTLLDEVSQKIRKHYLHDQKLDQSNFVDFVQIFSDRFALLDTHKSAKLQASVVKSPVYFYLFSYRGAHYWYETFAERQEDYGASHSEDTSFILKTPDVDSTSTEEDRRMIEIFVEMFTSFAKTGIPKTSGPWTPISKNPKDEIVALLIKSPDKLVMERVVLENEKFWESLPIMENEKLVSKRVKDEL
ncbi:venom carboxylesterase-6-like isoform X2 [Tenebrio molitor]|uniref:venom carboxylesterase-6-like isoform X2 n=1 Tax=Tenebrio molitor TaxID=7067 RepID=UPI0036247BCD